MQSYMSALKLRKSTSGTFTSQFNTYQGEIIRNSHLTTLKKQKSNRRVITEHCDKSNCISSQIKKATKQFKLPFRSMSPNLKKCIPEHHSSKKNCLLNANMTKKKSTVLNKINIQKVNTQTGVLIKKKKVNAVQKKLHFPKQQKILSKQQKILSKQQKSMNILKQVAKKELPKKDEKNQQNQNQKRLKVQPKKLKDSKSQLNLSKYNKLRLHTQGTFDCTPNLLGQNDIQIMCLIGQGTFGKVYKGRIIKSGELVAIKKVFQDPKYKNREIQIVSMLDGQFVMKVIGTYTTVEQGSQYLSIIMNYYDCDLFNYIKSQGKKCLSTFDIKLITYQLFRGLNYIHSLGICHRDIKPHNILIKDKKVVICDFGSAKILTDEPNLPYICSRCYRAPELIFGATHYSGMIDIWSVGCVILQMINSIPLFIGESSIDHLIEIIKVMGTPTKTQVIDMNPQYDLNDYKFPKIKKKQWSKIFPKADQQLLDLLSQIMIYSPNQRLTAAQALCHEFFDQLRDEKANRYIQAQFGIDLFTYSVEQLQGKQHLISKLIPAWIRK